MGSISLPTALAVSAAASAAGSIGTGLMGASAAKSAAKTQAQAAEDAIASTKDLFGQTKGELQPFIDTGAAAIPAVKNLLGLGPSGTAGITGALAATPGYQFTLQQGLQAAQSGFASQGLAESGPAIKGATSYAEGLAGTTYEQRLGDYLNLFGQGSAAGQALGGLTTATSGQLNPLITGAGAARASGTVGGTNALTGGISNALGGVSNAAITLGLNNAGMFGEPSEGVSGSTANSKFTTLLNQLYPG